MAVTVVFVHGSGGNAATWDAVIAALPARDCHAVTLPGRVGSPGDPAESAQEAAAWLAGELERRGLDDVVLVGHSFGGAIVLEAALQWSPPPRAIVLVATGARLRVHPAILAYFAEHSVMPGAWTAGLPAEAVARLEAAQAGVPHATMVTDWRAVDRFDRLGQLGAIEVPALVLVGRDDALTPVRYATRLRDELPRAELVVLDGGHLLPLVSPVEVAEHIDRFCADRLRDPPRR